jgi:Regulator of polyketide synthase expression
MESESPLHRVSAAMLGDFETIMAEATNRIWLQVPAYADVMVQRDELADRVRENIAIVIECLMKDRRPSQVELDRALKNGERRALQGVAHEAIIQSFRNAERTLDDSLAQWCAQFRMDGDSTRIAKRQMVDHLDAIERAMLSGFVAMRMRISTQNALTEPDLVNRLVSGQVIPAQEVEYLAIALGWGQEDVSGSRFLGVCVALAEESELHDLVSIRHRMVAKLHAVIGQPILSGTVRTDSGLSIAAFAVPYAYAPEALAELTDAAISEVQPGLRALAAIGSPRIGLSEAGSSCREAISTLEVGRAQGVHSRTIIYSEVLLEVLALRNPMIMRQLHDEYIRPLSAYDFLEETLRCFLETDQSIAKTALRLRVHKNTVIYRVRRIQELTGLDLHLVRDVARAVLAIEGAAFAAADKGAEVPARP